MLRALAPRSLMVVPLVARDRVIGTVSVAFTRPGRRYRRAELAVAEEFAARAALALDNARLFRESREASRVRDEVLRVVAHDLRNPLNTISLTAGLLKEQSGRPDTRQRLEVIESSVSRADRLIQDLLEVARLQAGQLPLEIAEIDTTELLNEVVELHRAQASERGIRLEWDFPARLPDVQADRHRVLQVFGNLIGNALQFTPSAGRVRLQALANQAEVKFVIEDTGPGIQKEDLPRLFQPFWQRVKSSGGGAGLGLPISKGLVEAQGGRIWVESAPGAGSRFCFTLPVAVGTGRDQSLAAD